MAKTTFALKAYPTNAEFEAVASALVRGHDDSSLKDAQQVLVVEMKNKTLNGALIKEKMDPTFTHWKN